MILYRKKQRNFELEREKFEQALLKTQVEIQEQTLANVSRELHDNLGQIASLVKMNLMMITSEISPSDKEKLNDSIQLTGEIITGIKGISVSLHGENLKRFTLVEMIEADLVRYRRMGQLVIQFNHESEGQPLAVETQIFVYRMIQEVFNNILNHANAKQVTLSLFSRPGKFQLEIKDDGVGFNTKSVKKGSGLINLEERSKIINATLEINSQVNQGTKIKLSMDR